MTVSQMGKEIAKIVYTSLTHTVMSQIEIYVIKYFGVHKKKKLLVFKNASICSSIIISSKEDNKYFQYFHPVYGHL